MRDGCSVDFMRPSSNNFAIGTSPTGSVFDDDTRDTQQSVLPVGAGPGSDPSMGGSIAGDYNGR
jgi:hypothetical protein